MDDTETGGTGEPEHAVDGIGEPVDPALGVRMRSGLRWGLVNTVFSRVVGPVVGIVMARILTPEDFGIVAVALIALNGLIAVNELGVTNAVIRWPGDLADAARTATTIAIVGSIGLFVACFFAAPVFADQLNTPAATGVLRLLAVGVIIDGIAAVPIGLLTRGFRQDRRVFAEWASFAVSTPVTIGLALAGFGPWALAWGRLAGNLVNAVVLYALAPIRPRPGWDWPVAKDLLRFGVPLTLSSFLVFAMLNVDYVVVGRSLGTVALGFYTLAFNLSSMPWNMMSATIRPVAIPGFARFQHDREQLVGVFRRWLHLLSIFTIPICCVLGTLALPIIVVVYGQKWSAAAPVLVFLAALGALRVGFDYAYDLFVAVGQSKILVAIQALWLVALIPALTIGAELDGLRGVGIGHVVVALGIIGPVYAVALRRRHGITLRAIGAAVGRPLLGGAAAVLAGWLVAYLVGPDLLQVVLGGAVMVLVFGAIGITPRELRELPRTVIGRGRAAAAADATEA